MFSRPPFQFWQNGVVFVRDATAAAAAVLDRGGRHVTVRRRVPQERDREHAAQAQPSRDQRQDRRGRAHSRRRPVSQSVQQQRADPVQATRPERERTEGTRAARKIKYT